MKTAKQAPTAGQPMHVVATAGHVDHGKSTLVKALTGTDPDRLAEERQRGLTIDLGFAWTTLPAAGQVVFVDVPGHVRFISNMLAGVAVIEAGLLCVDAREGWRVQTEEHLRILDLIGLPAGMVALTKAGLVDPDRLAEVRDEVTRRTAGTVLADAPVVACDAIDRTGLDDVRRRLAEILTARPSRHTDHDRPRLWVDRSFSIAGAGTVVTGGVGHGTFVTGDRVAAVASGGATTARLRGIEALGRRVGSAPPGTRAALNLAGLDRRAVRRGDAVVRPGEWHPTTTVEATLAVLGSVDHEVTRRGAYLAYLGTGEHAVRLRLVGESCLIPDEIGTVRLALGHPLPLAPGDRYVLRETGRGEIVGGGELVDVEPRQRRSPRRQSGSTRQLVGEGEWVRANELQRRLGVTVEPLIGDWVVTPGTLRSARDELAARLDRSRPVGLDIARLDEREHAVLAQLASEDRVTIVAGYATGPGWRDELADHPFVRDLEENLFTPPAPATGQLPPEVLRALVRRGYVVVKHGVCFAATAPAAAATALGRLAGERPDGFTAGEARAALDTTRKRAVPLLELLDESGLTIRHGDRRRIRPLQTSRDP